MARHLPLGDPYFSGMSHTFDPTLRTRSDAPASDLCCQSSPYYEASKSAPESSTATQRPLGMAGIRAFGVSDRLTAESVDGLQVIYRSLASSQWRFLSVKYGWNLIPSWNRQGEHHETKARSDIGGECCVGADASN